MEVSVQEHTIEKKTQWGTLEKSLNQHKVIVNGSLAGYVGKTHFLPLCGFPQEWCKEVAEKCSKLLGRPVAEAQAPPSVSQLVGMLEAAGVKMDGDDD